MKEGDQSEYPPQQAAVGSPKSPPAKYSFWKTFKTKGRNDNGSTLRLIGGDSKADIDAVFGELKTAAGTFSIF